MEHGKGQWFTSGNFQLYCSLVLKNGVVMWIGSRRGACEKRRGARRMRVSWRECFGAADLKLQQRVGANRNWFSVSCKSIQLLQCWFLPLNSQKQQKQRTHDALASPLEHLEGRGVPGDSCPSISLFIRYYMQREAGEHEEVSHSDVAPSEDLSSQERPEESLSSEQKAEELRRSVDRLKHFASSLPLESIRTLPPCVEEYCDRISDYRLREDDCIIALAQRRLNKMLRNRKIKRNWNSEDITLLVWSVSKRIEQQGLAHFSELTRSDWEFIAAMVSGSSWQKCKFRWLGLKKVRLVLHKWSKAESKLLAEAVAEQDKVHWKLVSERLYERNPAKNKVFRTAKQCREHWNCFINPSIHKGPWSPQEDRRLLEYVLELEGAKKWSEIAKFMAGRTENALKNRFNLLLNLQKRISGDLTEKRLVRLCLSRLMLQEGQQERLQMQTPLSPPDSSSAPPPDATAQPIVPVVGSRAEGESSIGFQLCYDNLIGYLGSTLVPPVVPQNAYYIGFLFPHQF